MIWICCCGSVNFFGDFVTMLVFEKRCVKQLCLCSSCYYAWNVFCSCATFCLLLKLKAASFLQHISSMGAHVKVDDMV